MITHLKCTESIDFEITYRSLFADFIGYTKTDETSSRSSTNDPVEAVVTYVKGKDSK